MFPIASTLSPMVGGETHLQLKPALAFEHLADRSPADRANRVEHLRGVDPVSRDLVATDAQPQVRQPCRLLELHVGRTGYLTDDTDDLGRRRDEADSRSSPKTVIATSERTPAINSCTRSSMGCE